MTLTIQGICDICLWNLKGPPTCSCSKNHSHQQNKFNITFQNSFWHAMKVICHIKYLSTQMQLWPGQFCFQILDRNRGVKEALSPAAAECLRAVFAAFMWHEGIVHDAMACASFLKFHPDLTKEMSKFVKVWSVFLVLVLFLKVLF